jgi:ubiquinone/menaquinone biosynthesis C-methylase UbiE
VRLLVENREWNRERAERFARPVKRSAESIHAVLARRITSKWESGDNYYVFLDVGTGPGRLPVEIKALFPEARVIGIDPLEYMLTAARQNAEESGFSDIEILQGSAERIPLESETVDLVMAQWSLLFWDGPQKGLSEIYRILKPEGEITIYDWNKSYPRWKFYLRNFNTMLRTGWYRAKDVRRSFRKAYRFDKVMQMLLEANFKPIEAEELGMRFFIRAVKG